MKIQKFILIIIISSCFSNKYHKAVIQNDFTQLTKYISLNKKYIPDTCLFLNEKLGDSKMGPSDYKLNIILGFRDSISLSEFLLQNRINDTNKINNPKIINLILFKSKQMAFDLSNNSLRKVYKLPKHVLGAFIGGGGTCYIFDKNLLFMELMTN